MNVSPTPWTPSFLYTGDSQITRRNVVLPLSDGTADDRVINFAASLANEMDGDLILVNAVVRPSGVAIDHSEEVLDEHRTVAQQLLQTSLDPSTKVEARSTVRTGRTFSAVVREASKQFSAGAIVLDDSTPNTPFRRDATMRIVGSVDCDVITVGGNHTSSTVSSLLVPIAGGSHSGLAVDVARKVANAHEAWVELLHVVTEDAGDRARAEAEEYVAAGRERLGEFDDVDTWVLEADDVAKTIVEQSRYYDVTVIGAPQKNRLKEFVFGSTTDDVRTGAHNTVVTVERPHKRDSLLGGWL
ncbi:universal stress protein [Haladaptatus sp. NG-WS-4]